MGPKIQFSAVKSIHTTTSNEKYWYRTYIKARTWMHI